MFSPNPHSLPQKDYGGTGKRVFIALVLGTTLLICTLLLLIWVVPTLGFAAIHPILPTLVGIIVFTLILAILWLSFGLVFQAYTGQAIWGTGSLRGITIRLLLPCMELIGRVLRIPIPTIRRSFIKVNNELVLATQMKCEAKELLLLLPHCIQSSRCGHRLTYKIDNCARCGFCPISAILNLRDSLGFQVAIATGGTIARRIVVQIHPKIVIAVACERDLASGIQDTHPLPVFGVLNERPNGPCLDTCVRMETLNKAITHFIKSPQKNRAI